MPPNRKRATPRPRATRVAPYEQIASIEAPTNDPTAPAPADSSTPSVYPQPLVAYSTGPIQPGAPAASLGTDEAGNELQAEHKFLEEEEVWLVRTAVTWAMSRKLSLPLFYADLTATYNRDQGQRLEGHIQPFQAERKLHELEMRWRQDSGFRNSYSDLAQAVEIWMTRTREPEEKRRANRQEIVKRAERERAGLIETYLERDRMMHRMVNNIPRSPVRVDPNDDITDVTTEGDTSTDLDVTSDEDIHFKSGPSKPLPSKGKQKGNANNNTKATAPKPQTQPTSKAKQPARANDKSAKPNGKPKPATQGKRKRVYDYSSESEDSDYSDDSYDDRLNDLMSVMLENHKLDMQQREMDLQRRKDDLEFKRRMDAMNAKLDKVKELGIAKTEEVRESGVRKIMAYVAYITAVMEKQIRLRATEEAGDGQIEEQCLHMLATIKTITLTHASWPVTFPHWDRTGHSPDVALPTPEEYEAKSWPHVAMLDRYILAKDAGTVPPDTSFAQFSKERRARLSEGTV